MTKSKNARGYTLIEFLIILAIMGILASIIMPRATMVLDRAHQAKARGELGLLRSTINLYYSENEGTIPFFGYPDGTCEFQGISLSQVLVPRYIEKIPTPSLHDDVSFNGLSEPYDLQAKAQMQFTPPREMILVAGPPGYHPFTVHPFAYDQTSGNIYYNNGNRATSGEFFFDW